MHIKFIGTYHLFANDLGALAEIIALVCESSANSLTRLVKTRELGGGYRAYRPGACRGKLAVIGFLVSSVLAWHVPSLIDIYHLIVAGEIAERSGA